MIKINYWFITTLLITTVIVLPILTVFASFFGSTSGYFELLSNTFLLSYISQSLIILIGVLILTFFFGVFSAYFVSFYDFPGVNFFKWALILSFAVPAYIYAYSLTAFFENFGTLFSILVNLFGEGNYNKYIPKFDGMLGAILSMSFSLFGYVYVLTRASFFHQSNNLIEVSKNLGLSSKESFFRVILPSARPAITAGLALVAMECLADFGTVSFFSVQTLTTAIYNSWLAFDDLHTANQLSFVLLLIILIAFLIENFSRGGARYHHTSQGFKKIPKIKLSKSNSLSIIILLSLLFFLSFISPTSQMLYWTIKFPENLFDLKVFELLINTIYLVSLSSLILIIFSLISNYGNRVSKNKTLNVLSTLSISGYAIPGVILAIAFITFIAWFDDNLIKSFGFLSIKKIFIGSILGLVLVYFVRFYSLAFNGIKSGYEKINISVDESAYLLGYSKRKTFMNIHIPFLRNSLLFIVILISLEIIRELPITLILRPFNFETFATTAYISASEDLLEAAAVPALFLILIASFFIIITSKYILRDSND